MGGEGGDGELGHDAILYPVNYGTSVRPTITLKWCRRRCWVIAGSVLGWCSWRGSLSWHTGLRVFAGFRKTLCYSAGVRNSPPSPPPMCLLSLYVIVGVLFLKNRQQNRHEPAASEPRSRRRFLWWKGPTNYRTAQILYCRSSPRRLS